jgi:putative restriction endonuclease
VSPEWISPIETVVVYVASRGREPKLARTPDHLFARLDSCQQSPAFRQRVLRAYEYRCAVCGFDVRLGSVSIAPFDLGAFAVSGGVMLVSDQVNGTTGLYEALMAYHGEAVRAPQHPDWRTDPRHLEWHGREVFKGAARHHG